MDDAKAWLAALERAWGRSDERTFAIFDEESGEPSKVL
jgi:hypothetical protein